MGNEPTRRLRHRVSPRTESPFSPSRRTGRCARHRLTDTGRIIGPCTKKSERTARRTERSPSLRVPTRPRAGRALRRGSRRCPTGHLLQGKLGDRESIGHHSGPSTRAVQSAVEAIELCVGLSRLLRRPPKLFHRARQLPPDLHLRFRGPLGSHRQLLGFRAHQFSTILSSWAKRRSI